MHKPNEPPINPNPNLDGMRPAYPEGDHEKIVRNPSPEEMDALSNKNTVVGKPESKVELESLATQVKKPMPQTNEEPQQLKESTIFEPASKPFKLPSGKLIVPSGDLYVRRMTTVEEGMFQENVLEMTKKDEFTSKAFLEVTNLILDSCIKSKVSVYDLLIVDKIPLFIFVLSQTYGAVHKLGLYCLGCRREFDHDVNLDKIKVKYMSDDMVYPKIIQLDKFNFPVKLHLTFPSISDETLFTEQFTDPVLRYLSLISKMEGTLPNGNEITEDHYEEIVKNLHPDDKEKIKDFTTEFSELGFGTDITVKKKTCRNIDCEMKGKMQDAAVPLEAIFLKAF